MLGDTAGLAAGHIGGAQRIQQAGLAVIDMAHDGDHRGARLQVGVGVDRTFQAAFHIAFGHALGAVAEFLDHQFGGIGVDQLARRGHDAELHQRLDHVRRACRHTVGEFLNGDGVWQDNVAHNLDLIGAQPLQFRLTALTFALAAHRSQAAAAFVLTLDRRLHVDLA